MSMEKRKAVDVIVLALAEHAASWGWEKSGELTFKRENRSVVVELDQYLVGRWTCNEADEEKHYWRDGRVDDPTREDAIKMAQAFLSKGEMA